VGSLEKLSARQLAVAFDHRQQQHATAVSIAATEVASDYSHTAQTLFRFQVSRLSGQCHTVSSGAAVFHTGRQYQENAGSTAAAAHRSSFLNWPSGLE